jgi:chaperonin cofactor prefoldin
MSTLIRTLLAVAVAGTAFAVSAQPAEEHTQHHPSTQAASTTTQQDTPQAGVPMGMWSMPQMQQHMQQHMATMQALHTKMAAAKTPTEREALMVEHMKAMQEGMDMMKVMKPMGGMAGMQGIGDPGAATQDLPQRHQMMEMRMDMMQSMMRMMMDRMQSVPATK